MNMVSKEGPLYAYLNLVDNEANGMSWRLCNVLLYYDGVLKLQDDNLNNQSRNQLQKTFQLSTKWHIFTLNCTPHPGISPEIPPDKKESQVFGLTEPSGIVSWFLTDSESERDDWIAAIFSRITEKPPSSPQYSEYDNWPSAPFHINQDKKSVVSSQPVPFTPPYEPDFPVMFSNNATSGHIQNKPETQNYNSRERDSSDNENYFLFRCLHILCPFSASSETTVVYPGNQKEECCDCCNSCDDNCCGNYCGCDDACCNECDVCCSECSCCSECGECAACCNGCGPC